MRIYGCNQPPKLSPVEGIRPIERGLDMEPVHSDVQGLPASIQEQLARLPVFVGVQAPYQKPDARPTVRGQESHLMRPQLHNGRARVLQLDQVEVPGFIAGHHIRHPRGRPGLKPRQTDPRPLLLRPIPQILPKLPLPNLHLLGTDARVHQRERRVFGPLHRVPRWLLPLPG
jgi:hypothetical protein